MLYNCRFVQVARSLIQDLRKPSELSQIKEREDPKTGAILWHGEDFWEDQRRRAGAMQPACVSPVIFKRRVALRAPLVVAICVTALASTQCNSKNDEPPAQKDANLVDTSSSESPDASESPDVSDLGVIDQASSEAAVSDGSGGDTLPLWVDVKRCLNKCDRDDQCTWYGSIYKGCDKLARECRVCLTNEDCPEGPHVCGPGGSRCLQCTVNAHCKTGTGNIGTGLCDQQSGTCSRCETNDDCKSQLVGSTPYVCDASKHCVPCLKCSACQVNDDCKDLEGKPFGTGKCDARTGSCSKCESNDDCANNPGGRTKCSPKGVCVRCLSNNDCHAGKEDTGICVEATGECLGCDGQTICDQTWRPWWPGILYECTEEHLPL